MIPKLRETVVFLALVVLFFCIESTNSAVVFGTLNGWDSGGTDAICWVSNLTRPVVPERVSAIEYLNNELYGSKNASVSLLPSCYNGTSLVVTPLDLDPGSQMLTQRNYTFRLSLKTNLTNVNRNIKVASLGGKATIYARLFMCDAIRHGFCDPLKDLRQQDETLVPKQTDFGATASAFPNGDNRFQYSEGDVLVAIKDGTIIFSRWIKWTIHESDPGSDLYETTVDIGIRMPRGLARATYFFVGHVVMAFNVGNEYLQRVDIADAVPNNVLNVRPPPVIKTVSSEMKIALSVFIGAFGSMLLGVFLFLAYHRKHPVVQLAQGPFLIAIPALCLVSTVFSFTNMPLKDYDCRLRGPLVIAPISITGAILVARIWRVYVALSAAMAFARKDKKKKGRGCQCDVGASIVYLLSWIAALPLLVWKGEKARSVPLRQIVPASDALSLVVLLSFPQIFLQVFPVIYYKPEIIVDMDASGLNGRYVCEDNAKLFYYFGTVFTACIYLLGLVVAWVGRNLPSVFNEKDQVFQAAGISALLAFIVLALEIITDIDTTPPDVTVFLQSIISIGIPFIVVSMIVVPKIRRVMSGEKVVMTNLLANGLSTVKPMAPCKSDSVIAPSGANIITVEFQDRITLQKDDPLPHKIEKQIYHLQNTLQQVSEECEEGRALTAAEWKMLQQDVARLKMELDKIVIGWDDSFTQEAS